ncbi:MAG: hypothetical protein AAF830_03730 [Pseudomonadota bacterium]
MLYIAELVAAAPAVAAPEVAETTQAAPTWPLIVVLLIAMALAWRPRERQTASQRPGA